MLCELCIEIREEYTCVSVSLMGRRDGEHIRWRIKTIIHLHETVRGLCIILQCPYPNVSAHLITFCKYSINRVVAVAPFTKTPHKHSIHRDCSNQYFQTTRAEMSMQWLTTMNSTILFHSLCCFQQLLSTNKLWYNKCMLPAWPQMTDRQWQQLLWT